MKIGVPTEVKNREYRVALTPAGAHALTAAGHDVLVQSGAGVGSALPDAAYEAAGATLVPDAAQVWAEADLLLKVKEPVASEYGCLREGQVLFTYLHLAASRECTDALLASGTTAIAYETVQLQDRSLPLLAPMSEVAGRLAPQVGAYHLMRHGQENGVGRGVLLAGVPGVSGGDVVVIGGGVSGSSAASIALGMGAKVTLLDTSVPKLRDVDARFGGAVRTITSTAYSLEQAVTDADLVIGAVLVPGARAPKLVTDAMVAGMRPGSVLVDIAIDQGGCFEGSRPTTHDEPTYPVHDSVFYCVANMPGAVPHTSTYALANVTLPYVLTLAGHGWREALRRDAALAAGASTHEGHLTNTEVAAAHGLRAVDVATLLG